jgi:pimeloyl-ACP methyl ester carboxylesterase
MGRTPISLSLLATRLRRAGFPTSSFGYFASRTSLTEIAQGLIAHIEKACRGEPYAIVTHSLGGIITRLASSELPAGFTRFVMLAPPNAPSSMARAMRESRIFRALTGDAGERLGDASFYASLPVPAVPTMVIAGTAGPRMRALPFGDAPHDGIVAVAETRLSGAVHREVPCIHTFIMNDRGVTALVIDFLRAA